MDEPMEWGCLSAQCHPWVPLFLTIKDSGRDTELPRLPILAQSYALGSGRGNAGVRFILCHR